MTSKAVAKPIPESRETKALMATVTISPANDDRYLALKEQVQGLCESIGRTVIKSEHDVAGLNSEVNIARKIRTELESMRKHYGAPLRDYIKQIDGAFAILSSLIDTAEKDAKGKILAFHQEQAKEAERIRQENARKAREAAEMQRLIDEENERLRAEQTVDQETGEITGPDLIASDPEPEYQRPTSVLEKMTTDQGTSSVKMVGKWELEDFAKVPDAYKILNEKAINGMVRSGCREIPGLRIWEEPSVSFRSKG